MKEPINITFSIPERYRGMKPPLIKRIDLLAKSQDRSRSWVILQAILRYLEEEEAAYDEHHVHAE